MSHMSVFKANILEIKNEFSVSGRLHLFTRKHEIMMISLYFIRCSTTLMMNDDKKYGVP